MPTLLIFFFFVYVKNLKSQIALMVECEVMNLPIAKRWSRFRWDKLDEVPDVFGVYELADDNDYIIYIGSGRGFTAGI